MKKVLFISLICFLAGSVSSQINLEQSGVTFKRLFLDYQTLNGGDFGAFKDYTDGFEVSYFLPIADQLTLNIPLKVGLGNRTGEITNNRILGLDVHGNYHILKNPKTVSPYVLAGVGIAIENNDSTNIQVPMGFGLDFKIAPNAYFTWQSEFRLSSAEDHNNFHHGLGFKYTFGGGNSTSDIPEELVPNVVDSDGDGISDDLDLCPQEAGLAAFMGCPDSDNDGVQDSKDDCPEFAGLRELNGCPDTDGDGVSDNDDECPNIAGLKSNKGCPGTDTDGDGVLDSDDDCPNLAGPASTKGCPDTDKDGLADNVDRCPYQAGLMRFNGCPDTDGDGVEDKSDLCPNSAGPAENNGCPVIATADRQVLEFAMKAVQFEHSKATLTRASYSVLNQIGDIMARYPDYRIDIKGHTDSTGAADLNKRLSRQRAKACYDYLINQGVSSSRVSYEGFGAERPIANNETYAGRSLNRRVEFDLKPGY